jgi:hypothetical protein
MPIGAPAVLLVVFAALSAAGVYLIAAHFHSRRLGLLLAALTVLFFATLAAGLAWLAGTA